MVNNEFDRTKYITHYNTSPKIDKNYELCPQKSIQLC